MLIAWKLRNLAFFSGLLCLGALCTSCVSIHSLPSQKTKILAIVNATIIPMTGEGVQLNQTILIEDKKIIAVDSVDEILLPTNVIIFDGSGKFVLPGFSDSHAHVFDEGDLTLYLASGVTTLVNMSGSYMHLRLREEAKNGEKIAPRTLTTGPMIKDSTSPWIEFEETVNSIEAADEIVSAHVSAGYDAVKVWGSFSPEIYNAIATKAAELGIPLIGHIPRSISFDTALENQRGIAHVEEILKKGFSSSFASEALDQLSRKIAASDVIVISTLSVHKAIARSVADDPRILLDLPERALLDPVRQLLWEPRYNRYRTDGYPREQEQYLQSLQKIQQIALSLHKAGVPILAGVDAGELPGLVPGIGLHAELVLLVDAGFSEYDAIKTATANTGRVFSKPEDQFGTIKVGNTADLVVLNANPLIDISNTKSINAVIRQGKLYRRDALDAMLTALNARNQATNEFIKKISEESYIAEKRFFDSDAPKSSPPALMPLLMFALLQDQSGKRQLALSILEIATETHPLAPEPWFVISGFMLDQNDLEAAQSAFHEVLKRAPEHERARRELAKLAITHQFSRE